MKTSIGDTTSNFELPIAILFGFSDWIFKGPISRTSTFVGTISASEIEYGLLNELEESHRELELGEGKLLRTLRDLR